LIFCLILVACGGSDGSLAGMDQAKSNLKSFSYEMHFIPDDGEFTITKYWFKGNKARIIYVGAILGADGKYYDEVSYHDYEIGETVYYTSDDPEGTAILFRDENKAEMPENFQNTHYVEGHAIIGAEKIDGFQCQIVRSGDNPNALIWLSVKNGFPIKITVDYPDGGGRVQEYKNINFNKVKDADVTVPKDLNPVDVTGYMGQILPPDGDAI